MFSHKLPSGLWIVSCLTFFVPTCALNATSSKCFHPKQIEAHNIVVEKIDQTLGAFKKLITTINSGNRSNFNYDSIGTLSSLDSDYPASFYSRIQHLKRVIGTIQFEPTPFSETIIKKTIDALGSSSQSNEDNSRTLNNVLGRLTYYVQSAACFPDEINYFLGGTDQIPEKLNLPFPLSQAVGAVFNPLFDEWRTRTSYRTTDEDMNNVFSLLYQLQKAIDARDPEAPYPLSQPIGNINSSPHTLFGKALLLQKIIHAAVTSNYFAPIHYGRLHTLLTHPGKSIISALTQTIQALSEEGTTVPAELIEKRFEEIHELFKKTLVERIIELPAYWPEKLAFKNTWQGLFYQTAKVLLRPDMGDPSLERIKRFFFRPVSSQPHTFYPPDSLFAKITTLTNMLLDPSYILDHQDFEAWAKRIGNEIDQKENHTGTGFLNFLKTEGINLKSDGTDLKTFELYLGQPADRGETQKAPSSFFDVLNRLFQLRLEDFSTLLVHQGKEDPSSLPSLVSQLANRPDLPDHLKTMIGMPEDSSEEITLCGRINLLCESFDQLVQSNHFDWADWLSQSLFLNIPILQKALQVGIQSDSSQLWQQFGLAWWSDNGIYSALNSLINRQLGGGIQQTFSNHLPEKALLRPYTLKHYLDLIQTNLPGLAQIAPDLCQIIGTPPQGTIKKALTLQTRFSYLHDIIKKLSPFLTYNDAMEMYECVTAPKQGLITRFKELNDILIHTRILWNKKSSKGNDELDSAIGEARRILGHPGDAPSLENLSSTINFLFYKSSVALFDLILDKFKARQFGLKIQSKHSLHEDLSALQNFLQSNQNIEMSDSLELIGNNWDNAFAPSIFGRLASTEDVLLNMWDQAYYIPLYDILALAAQFYELTHRIINESWTVHAIAEIGNPLSPISELSLFGSLNYVIARCLTAPLGDSVQYILKMIPALHQGLFTSTVLSEDQRVELIDRISGFTEKPKEDSFTDLCPRISNAFYPVAGFFRFRQTEQFWGISQKIADLLEESTDYIQKNGKKCSVPASEIFQTIHQKIGTTQDSIDATPPTVFSLTYQLNAQLYSLYSILDPWVEDEVFSRTCADLETIKNKNFPGNCSLFYLTYNAQKIHQHLGFMTHCLETIATKTPGALLNSPESLDQFCEQKHQIFNEISEILSSIGNAFTKTERVMPSVLGTQKEELLRCTDISEYIVDATDSFSELEKAIENLTKLFQYPIDPFLIPEESADWNCDRLPFFLECIVQDFSQQSAAFDAIYTNIDSHIDRLFDVPNTASEIQTCEDALSTLTPCIKAIQTMIRNQANQRRTFHCPRCDVAKVATVWEKMVGSFDELCIKIDSIKRFFIQKSMTNPLFSSQEILTSAFRPHLLPIVDILFPVAYREDGLPAFTDQGQIQLDQDNIFSATQDIQSQAKSLIGRIMGEQAPVEPTESSLADHAQTRLKDSNVTG